MQMELLSSQLNITAEETEKIWQTFVTEVKKCWNNETDFIYPELLVQPKNLNIFSSEFILGLLDGKYSSDEYTQDIQDKQKQLFAKIIFFILDQATREPFTVDELGTFYLFGKLPKKRKNPQTGEFVTTNIAINLGFKRNFNTNNITQT